jgi:DNA-binding CsgD family transcriptional regulator
MMKESMFNREEILSEGEMVGTQEILESPKRFPSKDFQSLRISNREKEVLQWVEQGKSSSEISLILGISQRTVNSYIYKIMEKLEAVNRPQMVSIALRKGLLLQIIGTFFQVVFLD